MNRSINWIFFLLLLIGSATLVAQNNANSEIQTEKKHRLAPEQRKAMHEELKAYRAEVIFPKVREARVALEANISPEDRLEIARLRSVFDTRPRPEKRMRPQGEQSKEEKRAAMQERRAAMQQKMESWRKEHASDLEALAKLGEQYAPDVKAVLSPLKAERKQWSADRKAIHAKYGFEGHGKRHGKAGKGTKDQEARPKKGDEVRPEKIGTSDPGNKSEKARGNRPKKKALHFLMMDPAATSPAKIGRH
jgi:hypothetical protein